MYFSVEDPCLTSGCSDTCTPLAWNLYQCGCSKGFSLKDDKHTCVNIDECEEGIDICAQECIDTAGSYVCGCREGYRKVVDTYCEDVDECTKTTFNACQGTCINTVGSYLCINEQENTELETTAQQNTEQQITEQRNTSPALGM